MAGWSNFAHHKGETVLAGWNHHDDVQTAPAVKKMNTELPDGITGCGLRHIFATRFIVQQLDTRISWSISANSSATAL